MKKIILTPAFLLFLSLTCFADGQDGLGTFLLAIHILFIVLYTVAIGLVIRFTSYLMNRNMILSIRRSFGIAFIISVFIVLIGGIEVSPFYWSD